MTAANIMTKVEDLTVLTSFDNTFSTLDNMMQTRTFKGYPVVESRENMYLVGYAGRKELKFSISHLKNNPNFDMNTGCMFTASREEHGPFNLITWVDQTPYFIFSVQYSLFYCRFTTQLETPIATVYELFIKMGLRYLMVTKNGQLKGIITKKDLIRFTE